MQDNSNWFGLALYSPHIDEQSVGEWIRVALVESSGEVCGVQLAQVSTVSAKGWFGKLRDVSDKSLKDILKRSIQGKVNSIDGHDVVIDPNADLTDRKILYFDVTATQVYSSETRKLIVEGPKALYNETDVQSYARRLVNYFQIDYGCIVSGLSWFHVDTTITFTYSSHIEDDERLRQYGPDHPRKRFAKEISYYQSKRQQFGEFIPRACWGNILSPNHVEALGGEDKIRRESGAYLIERWGHNLYVQLTESLWDCTNDDLMRLNQFFTSARFPDAPDPVYLDRTSNAYLRY